MTDLISVCIFFPKIIHTSPPWNLVWVLGREVYSGEWFARCCHHWSRDQSPTDPFVCNWDERCSCGCREKASKSFSITVKHPIINTCLFLTPILSAACLTCQDDVCSAPVEPGPGRRWETPCIQGELLLSDSSSLSKLTRAKGRIDD